MSPSGVLELLIERRGAALSAVSSQIRHHHVCHSLVAAFIDQRAAAASPDVQDADEPGYGLLRLCDQRLSTSGEVP